MWPVLFRLGPIDITSFGAMVAVGRARRPVGVSAGAGPQRVARRGGRRRDLRPARRADRREAALRLRAPRREPVLLLAVRPRGHELVRRIRRRAGGRIHDDPPSRVAARCRSRGRDAGAGGRPDARPGGMLSRRRRLRQAHDLALGRSAFRADFHRPTSRSIRPSCTRPRFSRSSPGC